MRDRWLARERAKLGSARSTEIWTAAYARPAATPEEATAALSAGGKVPALSPAAYSERYVGESVRAAMGTLRFLAGDYDGALPYLRAVAASCNALVVPVTWLRAHHDLGVILEAKGDRVGACAAHKIVVDRWALGCR